MVAVTEFPGARVIRFPSKRAVELPKSEWKITERREAGDEGQMSLTEAAVARARASFELFLTTDPDIGTTFAAAEKISKAIQSMAIAYALNNTKEPT